MPDLNFMNVGDYYDVASSSDALSPVDADDGTGPGYLPDVTVEGSQDLLYSSELAADIITYDPVSLQSDTETDYVNVIRLNCSVNGRSVVILLSPEYIDKIFIDGAGRLWNMSASNITGRIVDASFNPYQTSGELVYLTPCLGNNFSIIQNYGSPNYIRRYYWSNSRLTYTDTYTEIVVDSYHYPFFASDIWNYAIFFILTIGVILAWLRNYKNY